MSSANHLSVVRNGMFRSGMFNRAACGADPVARDGAKRKISCPLSLATQGCMMGLSILELTAWVIVRKLPKANQKCAGRERI